MCVVVVGVCSRGSVEESTNRASGRRGINLSLFSDTY